VLGTITRYPDGTSFETGENGNGAWYDVNGNRFVRNETNVTTYIKRPGTPLGYDVITDYGDGVTNTLTAEGHRIQATADGQTLAQYANPNAEVRYDENGQLIVDYGEEGKTWYDAEGAQYVQNETNVTKHVRRPGTALGYDTVIDYGDGVTYTLTAEGHQIQTTADGQTITKYANPDVEASFDAEGNVIADYGVDGRIWFDASGNRHELSGTNETTYIKRPGTPLGYETIVDYGGEARLITEANGDQVLYAADGVVVRKYAHPGTGPEIITTYPDGRVDRETGVNPFAVRYPI